MKFNKKNILKVGTTIIIPIDGKDTEFIVLGINTNPNVDGSTDNIDYIDIMSKNMIMKSIWDGKT